MRNIGSTLAALFVLCLACGEVRGQEVGSKEWLEKARRIANDLAVPSDTYFEIEYRRFANGDEQLLADLEQQIEGKPEHPLRPQYIELARRLGNGPDVTHDRVWYFGPEQWRMSSDEPWNPNPRTPWHDSGRNEKDAWRLIPDTVTTLDTENPERGYNPTFEPTSAAIAWQYLLTQNIAKGPGWSLKQVDREGPQWVAVFENGDKTRESTCRGMIDDAGKLFIHEVVMTRSDDEPKWLGATRRFTPDTSGVLPELIPGLKPAIAMRHESPTGASYPEEWEILRVGKASQEGGLAVLAQPEPGGTDPVRNLATLTGLIDRTRGQQFVVDGGNIDRANPIPMANGSRDQTAFGRWGTPAVVVAISLVLGGLIVLRWRRSST